VTDPLIALFHARLERGRGCEMGVLYGPGISVTFMSSSPDRTSASRHGPRIGSAGLGYRLGSRLGTRVYIIGGAGTERRRVQNPDRGQARSATDGSARCRRRASEGE
jgi:hypothetical protein